MVGANWLGRVKEMDVNSQKKRERERDFEKWLRIFSHSKKSKQIIFTNIKNEGELQHSWTRQIPAIRQKLQQLKMVIKSADRESEASKMMVKSKMD